MPKYLVTLHRNLPDLKDRHEVEIEASSKTNAGQIALGDFGQIGWVVTHVEQMGGKNWSELINQTSMEYWAGYMPQVGDTVKVIGEATFLTQASDWKVTHTAPSTQQARIETINEKLARPTIAVVDWKDLELVKDADTERDDLKRIISKQGDENARLERQLTEQKRINEKTGQNIIKARRRRRNADLALEDLQAKHNNLTEKAAVTDIENQKLREALRYTEEQTLRDVNQIKRLEQQIDDLVHERPTEHQQGPTRDVSWEEPWAPQLAWDEELTLKTLIGQALGAASMCWSPAPTGVYWPEKAEWIMGGVINEIEKLQFKQSRRQYTGPIKPVEALVKEQDDDAGLWALAFGEHFDIPESKDAELAGWLANAMMTAVNKWRNAHEPKPVFFDGDTVPNNWTVTENLAEKTRSNLMPNPSFGIQKVAGHVINPDGSFGSAFKFEDNGTYEFVNAPKHYNDHPSGVECQVIIRECKDPMISFAMKHLWRSQWGGKPGQTIDQDFSKAIEYIQLEQARRAGKARL